MRRIETVFALGVNSNSFAISETVLWFPSIRIYIYLHILLQTPSDPLLPSRAQLQVPASAAPVRAPDRVGRAAVRRNHCARGADRAGLLAACASLVRPLCVCVYFSESDALLVCGAVFGLCRLFGAFIIHAILTSARSTSALPPFASWRTHCVFSLFALFSCASRAQAPQEEQQRRRGGGGGGGGDRHGGGGHGGGDGGHYGGDTRSGLQQAFGGAGGMSLGAMGGSGGGASSSSGIVGGVHRGPMNPERMAMLAGAPPPPMQTHMGLGAMGGMGGLGQGMGHLGQLGPMGGRGGGGGGGNSSSDPTKNLRRVYVGNLPAFAGEEHVRAFFCDVMRVRTNLEMTRISAMLLHAVCYEFPWAPALGDDDTNRPRSCSCFLAVACVCFFGVFTSVPWHARGFLARLVSGFLSFPCNSKIVIRSLSFSLPIFSRADRVLKPRAGRPGAVRLLEQ